MFYDSKPEAGMTLMFKDGNEISERSIILTPGS
jgi:hypothetical protein